ncbi:cytosol aminopeptidase [bacterium BMS3Abin07]|nr:cytosol aminopeptidase [bacterium BMS3Abin07]GBE31495.1 cytosol aminopeptidase [bacterium BMS3Bbin05]
MKIGYLDRKEIISGADALILPVIKGVKTPIFDEVDGALGGILSKAIDSKPAIADFEGCELMHIAGRGAPKMVLLSGLGKYDEIEAGLLRKAGGIAFSNIEGYKIKKAALSVGDMISNRIDARPFIEGFLLRDYSFEKYRNTKQYRGINVLNILKKRSRDDSDWAGWISAVVDSVNMVRDLVNSPSNHVRPSSMAGVARTLAGGRMKVKVLGTREIKKLGLNAFYSVAKGSKEEPEFIVMRYSGGMSKDIALVGKSVTFDSGGISLKPSKGMEKMKYDMAGGAVVLGVLKAVKELGLPVNLTGVIPACENLPGGSASRPGDIVKTYGGKTVEIVNTDAEGRLLLADAIEYTKKLSPGVIIDIATLTGACSVALGNEAIAMMGNDQEYMEKLRKASIDTGEKVWQMPLYREYGEYIRSDVADLKNSGGRSGSLVTAGYFLNEFAGDTPWVHLDIASTAWTDKDRPYSPKGATGMGVRLLMEFIRGTME